MHVESNFFCYSLQIGHLFFADDDDDDDDERLGRYTRNMLVSDDDDTGTGTGTGSRRCGAPPQLSAWLAKELAIPEVGIMQCLERRKAQEKKKVYILASLAPYMSNARIA